MTSTTLQQYFTAAHEAGVIDHSVRVVAARPDGRCDFYIHPSGADGETPQFAVFGNRLVLPAQADKTLVEDFSHFLAYSNLSASAELLVAYAEGRGEAITLMDAIIAVDPLMSATHAGLAAHQQEQVMEGAQVATITAPPLDGRVPTTARSAELRTTVEYVPPAGSDRQLTQISGFQGSSLNSKNTDNATTISNSKNPNDGDFHIIFEGHEHMSNLAHKFPLPYPGVKGGVISFYETQSGHTFDFLEEARGKLLSARIEHRDGRLAFSISSVKVTALYPCTDWSSGQPLEVPCDISWDASTVERITKQ